MPVREARFRLAPYRSMSLSSLFYRASVMGLIAGTLLYAPLAALAVAAALVLGISPLALLTFGDAVSAPVGLVAWWLISLVVGSIYAAFMHP